MSTLLWVAVVVLGVHAAAVLALIAVGRRTDARALAGFIPDCVVLVRRLLRDARVKRRTNVALVLRSFLRAGGGALVREHWPGPERTLGALRVG